MALTKLENLYRQVILDHSEHPRHYAKDIGATHALELVNPTCGDIITVKLNIIDNSIQEATFSGHGCSISKASASMMMEIIIGCTIEEAKQKMQAFFDLVQGKDITEDLKDADLLQGVSKFPARIKCATLSWKALEQLIDKDKTM